MSKYTTTVRWLIEGGFNLGLDKYPIFDESYRLILNQKIIDHYYFREIGLETPALFSWFLNTKMNEIMPYYNQLYESEKLKIVPLTRLDYSETLKKNNSQTGNINSQSKQTDKINGSTNETENSQSITSDTPQNMMLDSDISVSNEIPASEAGISKNSSNQSVNSTDTRDGSQETTQTVKTSEDYLKSIIGNNATRTDSEMLKEWRETFLNIDLLVIEELNDLFMCVY